MSCQATDSDGPQVQQATSHKQRRRRGEGIDAQIEPSVASLWAMFKHWRVLLPEKVRTTPMSTIIEEVNNIIRPINWDVVQYARRILKILWKQNRLPVQLVLFWRYPRADLFAYEIVYALMIHFGADKLPNVGQNPSADRRQQSQFLKIGRKALPPDFAELCTKIYGLNEEQQQWVRRWAESWYKGQRVRPAMQNLETFLQFKREWFVTGLSPAQDEVSPLQEIPSEAAPACQMEVAGPAVPDPFAQSDSVPLDDPWDEAPGMSILDPWSPNLGGWVRLEDADNLDDFFTFE